MSCQPQKFQRNQLVDRYHRVEENKANEELKSQELDEKELEDDDNWALLAAANCVRVRFCATFLVFFVREEMVQDLPD